MRVDNLEHLRVLRSDRTPGGDQADVVVAVCAEGAAAPAATGPARLGRAVQPRQTIDLQDLDRLDVLHRLDGFLGLREDFLHLISGDTIHNKVVSPKSNIEKWLKDPSLTDEQIIHRIFLTSLVRYPDQAERTQLLAELAAKERRQVYQDLLWAILNSKEFLYNH